jgi:hypothetical protein
VVAQKLEQRACGCAFLEQLDNGFKYRNVARAYHFSSLQYMNEVMHLTILVDVLWIAAIVTDLWRDQDTSEDILELEMVLTQLFSSMAQHSETIKT